MIDSLAVLLGASAQREPWRLIGPGLLSPPASSSALYDPRQLVSSLHRDTRSPHIFLRFWPLFTSGNFSAESRVLRGSADIVLFVVTVRRVGCCSDLLPPWVSRKSAHAI